ncbi:MAG: long-chain-fatty-acid--CoA ligase [Acidobacteriota bacterium]
MKVPLTPIRFLRRAESQFGDKTGVIDGFRQWTYHQYADRCRKLANLLLSWELPKSSTVAFLSYNTYPLLEAYYGVLLAGGVLLPLNIRLSAEDVRFILNDSGAECLFFHRDFADLLEEIRGELTTVRRFVVLDQGLEASWIEPGTYGELLQAQPRGLEQDVMEIDEDSVAEIFYTSGTTGHPKGVMLTHRNLYLHALESGLLLQGNDADVHLHTIPLFHVNGWGTPQLLACLGSTQVMLEKFDARGVLEEIQQRGVTTFPLVPTMATTLLHYPHLESFDVSSVRRITLGGSAANPRLVSELEEAFDCECFSGYGLTETSPVLTLSVLKDHLQLEGNERLTTQAMAGYPIPGVELKVVDDQDHELSWDGASAGEIIVRGNGVMEGYWKRPAETAEAMRSGWFHTGDIGTVDPNGYVQIVDRKKDLIISGGENISSIEVEKIVLGHSAVMECAVIPVPDSKWGEAPKALVVLKPGRSASQEEILNHCRSRLAGFKLPKSVEFFDSLPKGGTGKILKRELRNRCWQRQSRKVQ